MTEKMNRKRQRDVNDGLPHMSVLVGIIDYTDRGQTNSTHDAGLGTML